MYTTYTPGTSSKLYMLFYSPLHLNFSTIKHLLLDLVFEEVIGKSMRPLNHSERNVQN